MTAAAELEHDQEDAGDRPAEPRAVLDRKARKAVRERARRAAEAKFQAEEEARIRAELEAKRAQVPTERAAAPGPETAGTPPPAATDDSAQLADDAAAFLSGVLFPVLAYLASLFGPWRLDLKRFTDDDAKEDAAAWVPVLHRYPRLALVVRTVTAPARVIRRLRKLAEPKPPETAA